MATPGVVGLLLVVLACCLGFCGLGFWLVKKWKVRTDVVVMLLFPTFMVVIVLAVLTAIPILSTAAE